MSLHSPAASVKVLSMLSEPVWLWSLSGWFILEVKVWFMIQSCCPYSFYFINLNFPNLWWFCVSVRLFSLTSHPPSLLSRKSAGRFLQVIDYALFSGVVCSFAQILNFKQLPHSSLETEEISNLAIELCDAAILFNTCSSVWVFLNALRPENKALWPASTGASGSITTLLTVRKGKLFFFWWISWLKCSDLIRLKGFTSVEHILP